MAAQPHPMEAATEQPNVMPPQLSFRDLYALWRAGVLLSRDVPSLATELLSAGVSAKAVEDIAWMHDPVAAELEPAFARAAAELSEILPASNACAWRAAYLIAADIVSARVTPLLGAEALWRLSVELDLPEALLSFIYYASDYGEGPGDRASEEEWFDQQILSDASELLRVRPADGESAPRRAA